MKKVLFLSSLYYPHVGGVETMIAELSQYCLKKGIEPIILTKKWPTTLAEIDEYNGIKIYRIVSARTDDEFASVIDWLKDNEDKIRADIIHVIGVRRPLPLIGLLLSLKWKIPLVCTVAGGDIPDKTDPYPGTIWNESKMTVYPVLEQASIITCVSYDIEKDFRYFFPDIKTPIETQYAGIDIDLINRILPEKLYNNYIFSLRRLDPTKGIHILIEAFSTIIKIYPDLRLVIAGDGSERAKLEDLTRQLKVDDKIDFIGTINLERGISLLKGARLTVVPSLSEAGGLVNVEAQAAGCPVVATRVGGIPEYVSDGESGLLCETGNVDDLVVKISSILENEDLRKDLIKGGFVHAEKFNWNNLAPQYLSLYKRLIGEISSRELPKDVLFNSLWNRLIK